MAERNINDFLLSGEALGLRVQNTIDFVDSPESNDGMFLRISKEGYVYGHKVKNQDIEMVTTDATDKVVGTTETDILSITTDNDVTKENGSWLFLCKIDNGSNNRDDVVTFVFRDGSGAALASKPVTIDKGDKGYSVAFFGSFTQDWASGETFKVTAISNQGSAIKGTLTPTSLKIVEAEAAPVTLNTLNGFNFNTLPASDPAIDGRLYVDGGTLKVSQG